VHIVCISISRTALPLWKVTVFQARPVHSAAMRWDPGIAAAAAVASAHRAAMMGALEAHRSATAQVGISYDSPRATGDI